MAKQPTKAEIENIDAIVAKYVSEKHLVTQIMDSTVGYLNLPELIPLVHSIKSRVKHPDHLKDKLYRKLNDRKSAGIKFDYTPDNLYKKVTDLAGVRILHLHSTQIADIHKCIMAIIDEQPVKLLEKPFARTWDDENRALFQKVGIRTQDSPTMYTSVHYVIGSGSRSGIACEIQVRTLMEEVWGEVDHTINYPHANKSVACREQIRALARVTSSSTRLVDAIFATVKDIKDKEAVR